MERPEVKMPVLLTETQIQEIHAKKTIQFQSVAAVIIASGIACFAYLVMSFPVGEIYQYLYGLLVFAFVVFLFVDLAGAIICPEHYTWITPDYCKDLVEICAAHPELNAYRKQVLAQGREFTILEDRDLKIASYELNRLAKYNEQLAHCKTLYTA